MTKRNLIVGLVGVVILAAVIWAAVVAVPRLTGELTGIPSSGERLAAEPNVVDSDLVFASATGTVGSWITTAAVFGSDGFIYALSTAPGVREVPFGVPAPHAVYRSQDGVEWLTELMDDLGDDLFVRDIAFSGANLYVVGTAPSAADPTRAAVRVGDSSDSGQSWVSVDLDPGDAAQGATGAMLVDVVANRTGALVGATSGMSVDGFSSSVALYFGKTSQDLELRASPFDDGYAIDRLAATGDAFYAIVRPTGMAGVTLLELWRSSDGLQWGRLDNFPFVDTVFAFGEVGDRVVVAGQDGGSLVVGATLDGAVWDEVDLFDLVASAPPGNQWVSAGGIGPAGLYLNVQTWIPNNGPNGGSEVVQFIDTPDLRNWSTTPTGTIAGGFVDQVIVADDFVFVNATTGLVAGRVHLIGTRE